MVVFHSYVRPERVLGEMHRKKGVWGPLVWFDIATSSWFCRVNAAEKQIHCSSSFVGGI